MTQQHNADKLRATMAEHGLTQREVARLTGTSPKTVESWLAARDAASFREMPARHLRMLQLSLPQHLDAKRAAKG